VKVVEDVAGLVEHRRVRGAGATGLVPTLGALHEGHLALVRRAKAENARAWASIFVNPAQFDEPGDLASYPRTLDRDLALLRRAGCDLVFLPRAEEIYRDGYRYRVTENSLSLQLEGASRPGHFDGVLTVVRYGQTGRAGLTRALETIPEEKSLGLVFNAAELKFSGYYYSYEYAKQ